MQAPPPPPKNLPTPKQQQQTICRRAKYTLEHLVRVNLAGQDRAYRCVYQLEDENGEWRLCVGVVACTGPS